MRVDLGRYEPSYFQRHLIAGAIGLAGAGLAVKLLLRPRDVKWDEHAHHLHHAEHSRFALVDGAWVHYQEVGASDAPPLLLIHGFTASNFVWSEVLLPVAESGFRVIAPDLVGFGFSGKPKDGEYTIEAQSQMIIGLMDHLGVKTAHVVGNSLGGGAAIKMALESPDRVIRGRKLRRVDDIAEVPAVNAGRGEREQLGWRKVVSVADLMFGQI